LDTVGGTTYDCQVSGPTYRFAVNSPTYGVHVAWMYSSDTTGHHPDLNMRYNFYDFGFLTWNWLDPDFMASGFNVFAERAGFGSLSADRKSGVATISCQAGAGRVRPVVARDVLAGVGVFEFCDGAPTLEGYLCPPIDVDTANAIHLHCLDDTSRNAWYSKGEPWGTWSVPVQSATLAPAFPTHQVACSRNGDKVCLTWVVVTRDEYPYRGYYRLSSDRGASWDTEANLGFPPAYSNSPDTGASYYVTSLNPFYDAQERLHIVVDVMPILRYGGGADTAFRWPNEIWHWCPDNTPEWSRIARAEGDVHAAYDPGSNALLAGRPQLGTDSRGNLFAVWEQFDTTNADPLTTLLRADIWVSGSSDNGSSWTPPVMIAAAGTNSLRFPSITDVATPGESGRDTLGILYLVDQVAGCRAGSMPIGPWSSNPIVFQKVLAESVGIAEPSRGQEFPTGKQGSYLWAEPNPSPGRVVIAYTLSRPGEVSLVLRDAAGRPIETLVSGPREPGRHYATWRPKQTASGIYFCTLTSGELSLTKKLVLTR